MASELAAREWADVLTSGSSVNQLLSRNALRQGADPDRRMSRATCEFLQEQLRELSRGAEVLAGLSGVDLSAERRDAYSERAC